MAATHSHDEQASSVHNVVDESANRERVEEWLDGKISHLNRSIREEVKMCKSQGYHWNVGPRRQVIVKQALATQQSMFAMFDNTDYDDPAGDLHSASINYEGRG